MLSNEDVIPKMSPSILLDETEPWLLAALASGIFLLLTLMMLFKCPRRKRANCKSETNVPTSLSAESPSEELVVEVKIPSKRASSIIL